MCDDDKKRNKMEMKMKKKKKTNEMMEKISWLTFDGFTLYNRHFHFNRMIVIFIL